MDSVFLLWFVPEGKDDDDALLIGVYSREHEARSAIERLKGRPGFIDYPDGFQICPYELDQDHWTEGFVYTED